MLNHVSVAGRLTRDPEMRRTGSGVPVTSFTLAVDRDFSKDKECDFFDVVAWRNTAEFVNSYFKQGRVAIVAGRLQTRSWTDKDGNKRKTVEIVAENVYFGDSKKSDAGEKYEAAKSSELDHDYPAIYGDDSNLPF